MWPPTLSHITYHNILEAHPHYSSYQCLLPFWGWRIFLCVYIPHFTCPFISWCNCFHLLTIYVCVCVWVCVCFNLLTIVNSAAMDIHVQVFVGVPVSDLFGYKFRSRIAESYGNSGNHQTVVQHSHTILHSHQQGIWILISLYHHQHSLLSFFLFFFLLFRAAPMAHGGSQARGLIGATATRDPSHIFGLYHSSLQCRILNPVSEARDWTHILMDTSQVC